MWRILQEFGTPGAVAAAALGTTTTIVGAVRRRPGGAVVRLIAICTTHADRRTTCLDIMRADLEALRIQAAQHTGTPIESYLPAPAHNDGSRQPGRDPADPAAAGPAHRPAPVPAGMQQVPGKPADAVGGSCYSRPYE